MITNRKKFLQSSAILGLGLLFGTDKTDAKNNSKLNSKDKDFSLPPLGYSYDSLEPFIDAKTMEIHYTKHHQSYLNKLNELKQKDNSWWNYQLNFEEMLGNLKNANKEIQQSVRNNLGGHWNHSFFWQMLKKNTIPDSNTKVVFEKNFGSFENFKKEFTKAALSIFGSGWAWVILLDDKLQITTTPNQDNPLMDFAAKKGKPILGLDVWEHAYYLKHQNKRVDYIENFFNVINWDKISENLK